MKRIHKYFLTVQEEPQHLHIPTAAKVLAVGEQYASPIIWVEFNTNNEDRLEERIFQVVGTGWDFIEGGDYCGTVQMKNGFVWHVYERRF